MTFKEFIFRTLLPLIDSATLLMASLALLVFFWGLARFIFKIGSGGDAKAVAEGKQLMIWGVIAIFVMVSIWGILRFFSQDVGFGALSFPKFRPYP